jgi:UDPglucose--hexose-1-phosphate uridylyltransferase
MNLFRYPHRRLNVLTGEWVLVSPHRTERPWQGKTDEAEDEPRSAYDPGCYLCPGNARASGERNPRYDGTFAFTNDFPALLPDAPAGELDRGGLLVARSERGTCRVLCYSPRHDLFLPLMKRAAVERVVEAWIGEWRSLSETPGIASVQIFENRGELMGCSNPHPHCQIWADERVTPVLERETARFLERRREKRSCLLCDYLALELGERERVVFENASFAALVPFWAVWPFETLLLPKEHLTGLDRLGDRGRDDLADALIRLETRYDNLFRAPFPFSMGAHQRPAAGGPHAEWHFHFHFYPPLLRSATVRKFMVGYELLALPQRDITAETAAERLRNLPERHYLLEKSP